MAFLSLKKGNEERTCVHFWVFFFFLLLSIIILGLEIHRNFDFVSIECVMRSQVVLELLAPSPNTYSDCLSVHRAEF